MCFVVILFLGCGVRKVGFLSIEKEIKQKMCAFIIIEFSLRWFECRNVWQKQTETFQTIDWIMCVCVAGWNGFGRFGAPFCIDCSQCPRCDLRVTCIFLNMRVYRPQHTHTRIEKMTILYSQVGCDKSSESIQNDLFIVSAARDACGLTIVDENLVEIDPLAGALRGWNNDAVTTVWRGTNDGLAIVDWIFPNESRLTATIGCINDAVTVCGARAIPLFPLLLLIFNWCSPLPIVLNGCFAAIGIVLNTDAVTAFGLGLATFNWFAIKTRRIGGSGNTNKLSTILTLFNCWFSCSCLFTTFNG